MVKSVVELESDGGTSLHQEGLACNTGVDVAPHRGRGDVLNGAVVHGLANSSGSGTASSYDGVPDVCCRFVSEIIWVKPTRKTHSGRRRPERRQPRRREMRGTSCCWRGVRLDAADRCSKLEGFYTLQRPATLGKALEHKVDCLHLGSPTANSKLVKGVGAVHSR